MLKTKRFIFAKHFEGEPKESDFKIVEEDLPALNNGEFLCQAEFLSVDPYMRPYTARLPTGITMIGSQVAKVIESKNNDFPVGCHVVGYFGWQTYTISTGKSESQAIGNPPPYKLSDFGNLPMSLALGALGMPGNTAYFGLLELCQPKPGEVVVVSGAAGAVGSLVGQIARIKGCKVIGFAGSDDKVNWLKKDLKFDSAYNYKKVDLNAALKEAAPKGVDCYFDNVGGEFSSIVLNHMNTYGRIAVCGSISSYNEDPTKLPKVPVIQPALVFKQLKMEGFIVYRWLDRWEEGIKQNLQWIKEGKLQHRETVTKGFENMPKAFIGMLRGENTGKAVVKV